MKKELIIPGALLGGGLFVADQITKYLALFALQGGNIAVLPFFNLVLVWNRGVSFGMFSDGNDLTPYVLIALSLFITAGLLWWLTRIDDKPLFLAICAVIGGAIGNIIDRIIHGAVIDFLDFHAFGWHYPAFNIADSAIVLGIAFILFDSIIREPKRKGSQRDEKRS